MGRCRVSITGYGNEGGPGFLQHLWRVLAWKDRGTDAPVGVDIQAQIMGIDAKCVWVGASLDDFAGSRGSP